MAVNRPSITPRKSTRHPAVIDTLGAAPTTTATPGRRSTASAGGRADLTAPAQHPTPPKRARKVALRGGKKTVVGAVAIAAAGAVGWSVLQPDESAPTTPAAPSAAALDELVTPTPTQAPEATQSPTAASNVGDACRTDRGDQKSGEGVIAAFEHAYYVTRSGQAARALAAPDSPLPAPEKIQAGIDTVPIGTNYCLRTITISGGHYSVVLSEMRPGQPATQFTQTITTKQIDGRWFVDVIT
ncbi:hypothetical protein SAMN04490239_9305 [Rhodococcus koreensis]|uniref:DUF8176 domain-containing protein n=1 Tax=Rhodococcus koreensis TaxID=99653 RepID=A0A1H5ENV8_9NOCA|nr:hypothetical protein SAMN04490239_9305 [Rhodococcus koreensis]